MALYFLRLEAVNFDGIIDDTDNLSTRRGGSLMILEAATSVLDRLPESLFGRLERIATGASIGLFQFQANGDGDAQEVRDAVDNALRDRSLAAKDRLPLHHGTFVVDHVPASGDFARDVALLTARNRWRQLCEPTIAMHDLWPEQASAGESASVAFPGLSAFRHEKDHVVPADFCAKDRIRPATRRIRVGGGGEELVSTAVAERLEYGRKARQRFYAKELGSSPKMEFTDDLQTLAKLPSTSSEDGAWKTVPGNTDGKVAVFYVDGNCFGSMSANRLQAGVKSYKEWSDALRDHHRKLLADLLQRIAGDPTWQSPPPAKNAHDVNADHEQVVARLETLLWGGDEMMWVVPAWKGWELASWFFAQAHQVQGETLTYGGGLVFAHANAPIKNLSKLAYELADLAKSVGKRVNGHRLAYEVLESLDDVTGDLNVHRQRWLPRNASPDLLVIDPIRKLEDDSVLAEHLSHLAAHGDLPVRQLYLLCQNWRKDSEGAKVREHRHRIAMAIGEDTCAAIEKFFDGNQVAWLHVLQMLPYYAAEQTPVSP